MGFLWFRLSFFKMAAEEELKVMVRKIVMEIFQSIHVETGYQPMKNV